MSGFGLELTERQRTLLAALYPVLLLLIINPFLEIFANNWPLAFDDPRWRVAFLGALLGAMLPVLMGLALIALVAGLLGQGGAIRAVAIAAFLVALLLMASGMMFGLDALQVRRMVRVDQRTGFDAASFKTLFMTALMIIVSAWLGIRGWASSRGTVGKGGSRKDGLVVGQ